MNAEVFKKELEKYSVVRRSDYCKSRSSSSRPVHKIEPLKAQDNQAAKVLAAAADLDFRTMVDKGSKKILDRQEQVKFIVELNKILRKIHRLVNLEILEDLAKEDV